MGFGASGAAGARIGACGMRRQLRSAAARPHPAGPPSGPASSSQTLAKAALAGAAAVAPEAPRSTARDPADSPSQPLSLDPPMAALAAGVPGQSANDLNSYIDSMMGSIEQMDPSLSDGATTLFSREVPLELRVFDVSTDGPQQVGTLEPIKVKVLALGDERRPSSVRIELSSEADLFFHYTTTMDSLQFALLQEQQQVCSCAMSNARTPSRARLLSPPERSHPPPSPRRVPPPQLMVEFADFASMIVRMLDDVCTEPHKHLGKFTMQPGVNGTARLDFIQDMTYVKRALLLLLLPRSLLPCAAFSSCCRLLRPLRPLQLHLRLLTHSLTNAYRLSQVQVRRPHLARVRARRRAARAAAHHLPVQRHEEPAGAHAEPPAGAQQHRSHEVAWPPHAAPPPHRLLGGRDRRQQEKGQPIRGWGVLIFNE